MLVRSSDSDNSMNWFFGTLNGAEESLETLSTTNKSINEQLTHESVALPRVQSDRDAG